jgi:hypothetical protein
MTQNLMILVPNFSIGARTAFGYSNFINLLTRIRLEENQYKEKEPNSLLMTA